MENEKQEINPIEHLDSQCSPSIKGTSWEYLEDKALTALEKIDNTLDSKDQLGLLTLLLTDMKFNLDYWYISQFKNISDILQYPYENYEMMVYVYVLRKLTSAAETKAPIVVKSTITQLKKALALHKKTVEKTGYLEITVLSRWFYFCNEITDPCDLTNEVKRFLSDVLLNLEWIKWIGESYDTTSGNNELNKMVNFVRLRLPLKAEYLGGDVKGKQKAGVLKLLFKYLQMRDRFLCEDNAMLFVTQLGETKEFIENVLEIIDSTN